MAGYQNDDFIAVVYGTTDNTYLFYKGGTTGTLVATVVLVYSDTAKGTLVQVVKT